MKKGVEFGFRAAGEVVRDAAEMAGKNALFNALPIKNPNLLIAADKAYKTQGASKVFFGGYEKQAKNLEERIKRIQSDIYGEGQ